MAEIPANVKAAFDAMEPAVARHLLDVRALILDEADSDPRIGDLTETLKWGQPSYHPVKPRIGTTLRLGAHDGGPALFVPCQTTLASDLRETLGDALEIDGARAILLPEGALPEDALRFAIRAGLTYHIAKRQVGKGASALN